MKNRATVTFESALHFYPDTNSYMPYGGRVAVCSVPVEWPAMPDRRLTDIWIILVVQSLARHPSDVCDALPDIGQASTDLLAIRLR